MDIALLRELAASLVNPAVKMTQRMIQTPSVSGNEGGMAALTASYMRDLAFDSVTVDEAGNVIGCIKGGGAKAIMFNCHLDTVAPSSSAWKYDPFAGTVADGRIWGLGASDTKGAFACQLVAVAALKKAGLVPPGDIWVVGVIHEETAGFGSIHLSQTLAPAIVVLGEATNNEIRIGHRGRCQFDITFRGKSAHASMPALGSNPHFAAARLILALENLQMKADPMFGTTSLAPTLYSTDQTSSNVTPGRVELSLDCRNIPGDSEASLLQRIRALVDDCLIPGVTADIEIKMRDLVCYNGFKGRAPAGEPSFVTSPDDADVVRAQAILQTAFDREVKVGMCGFATDGGHFRAKGSKVIVFAPSEEQHCHTVEDSISIDKMQEAILGNMALALGMGADKHGNRPATTIEKEVEKHG